jgi:hypothetical protein
MSDYLDYENNLAFDPTSADDLNEQGRQSEVLIKAIEKCERLEKENQQLKELLKECRDFVELVNIIDGGKPELLTKIDNAIGEKK